MLFACDVLPDLAIQRDLHMTAGAFIMAQLKVTKQRQRSPWQLHQMEELPRSQGCPFVWSLLLPLVTGMEKVQGMKHQPTQEQTAFGIAFQKADGLQFPFGVADLQADVGGFICVS